MICGECKQECEVYVEDLGIGAYEFWGGKGHDSRKVLSSKCCEDAVYSGLDEDGNLIGDVLSPLDAEPEPAFD